MSITISCPHCSSRYAVAEAVLGKSVKCKTCQNRFEAIAEEEAAEPEPEPEAPAAPSRSSDAGSLFDDEDLMSSAAAAPALARPKSSEQGSGEKKRKRKVRTYREDGCWYAEVSLQQMALCPGIWLLGFCSLIGFAMLYWVWTSTPMDDSFVWWSLGIGGGAWVVGFFVLNHYYYGVWSDFGERKLLVRDAPEPTWMKVLEYVSLGSVMLALSAFGRASEEQGLKKDAMMMLGSMAADKAALKAAIDEFHNSCWVKAQEGFGKRSRTNHQTYIDAMREKLRTRFAAPRARREQNDMGWGGAIRLAGRWHGRCAVRPARPLVSAPEFLAVVGG